MSKPITTYLDQGIIAYVAALNLQQSIRGEILKKKTDSNRPCRKQYIGSMRTSAGINDWQFCKRA